MGEIDLIMTHKDSVIVFVEVKTRKSDEYAQPEESVNYPKRKRMVRAAHYFLSQYKIEDRPLRFDVVAVVTGDNKQKPQIRHYENVFNG
jgi:putative endonuclease